MILFARKLSGCSVRDAKYKKLLEALKTDIFSGKYASGQPFPSVRALVNRFGIARSTIAHALDELSHQGLISRKQGRGTFVSFAGALRKIGLIMPDATQSEYFVRIFRELMRVAECRQYELLFGEIRGATAEERAACAERLVDDFIRQRVAGVIFQPIEYYSGGDAFNRRMLSRLEGARIPTVLCDNGIGVDACTCDVVGTDNIASSRLLYRHLVEAGARRICFFMRPYSAQSHFGRAQGFVLAHLPRLTGTCGKESVLVAEPDDAAAVRRRVRTSGTDAFMCGDDETAAKLMQTLHKLGYKVPDDILVTGFNDLNVARLLSPALTTLRVNCEAVADAAFDRLIARIANPSQPPMEIFLPVELVVRESTVRKRGNEKG